MPSCPARRDRRILGDFMAKEAEADGITQEEAEQGFLRAMRPTTLIQRFATTEEVVNMIVYACSKQASATTGAAPRVEGGVVRFVA
jgi:NAD(P)-dependent dehydrogenase (short-subunit alcohol dehydrogenase family)